MKKLITNNSSNSFEASGTTVKFLFCCLLFLLVFDVNAQTNWTARSKHLLSDVAYGAGKYVAIGDYGLIQTSNDGISWKVQADGTAQSDGLSAIIYENGKFVIVGYAGQIMTSTDGSTWTDRISGTTNGLSSITFGGGQFIAVGGNGTIITSTDGVTWLKRVSGTVNSFTGISFSNGMFVAVGQSGIVKTSTTGINWTTRTLPISGSGLQSVTVGKNGNFVAVGDLSVVVSSTDGIIWKYHPVTGPTMMLTGIAYNTVQGQYVAVSAESNKVVVSLDGISWKQTASIINSSLFGVRYLNGQFLAVGEVNIVCSSPNGYTWKEITLSKEIDLYGVAYGNGRYVAVGDFPAEYNRALASTASVTTTDGVNFSTGETVQLVGGAKKFFDVAFGNGLFVAVGEDATIQTSADGKAWNNRKVFFGKMLKSIAYGAGWFVAIGEDGLFCRSSDGINWMQSSVGALRDYNGITYANGQFMAVGNGGAVSTSKDGLLWTHQQLSNYQLKSVAYGNGIWVIVGFDGIVAWSFNGIMWQSNIIPSIYFNNIAFGNGQFVAVGLEGKVLTSATGFTWTPRQSKASNHLNSILFTNGKFLAVGNMGSVITSSDNKSGAAKLQSTESDELFLDVKSQFLNEVSEKKILLKATAFPNPVTDNLTVDINGATGEQVRLLLVDLTGRTLIDKVIEVKSEHHQENIQMQQKPTGFYILKVKTPMQMHTVKVLKQ